MKLVRQVVAVLVLASIFAACGSDGSNDSNEEGTETGNTNSDDMDSGDTESDVPIPDNYYSVTVNGKAVPVERISKFVVPVNYVTLDYPGESLDIEITPKESFTDYTLSPKSRNIGETSTGESLSFAIDAPIYMVLQIPNQERLFILIDPPEDNPPSLDDPDVKSIMDYDGVDNTGETDLTEIIQSAIDEASGADQNILYFPPGIYSTGMLRFKDDMTMYLAKGAILQNATPQASLMKHSEDLVLISEGCSESFLVMKGVTNAKLIGRGVVDGNGVDIRSYNRKQFNIKIEDSTDCVVEGIVSRDAPFWNTFTYRSDNITIENYKVINNRLDGEYNETDGVDFGNTTNSKLYNAFLYTGDDCMAVKSDDIPDDEPVSGIIDPSTGPVMELADCSHEKVICFSGSAGCKIGTKTFGHKITNMHWKDVDVITADRAIVIDAVDTATITGTVFEDIRVEHAGGRLIDFNMDKTSLFWRTTPGTCTVNDTIVKNVSSDSNAECRLTGVLHDWDETDPLYGNAYYYNGISFENFSIEGNVINSLDDPNAKFNTDDYVTDVTFAD
jgi:hypothetical protein